MAGTTGLEPAASAVTDFPSGSASKMNRWLMADFLP